MSNCVGCGRCCVDFAIAELNKPAGVSCEHLRYQGKAGLGCYVCVIHHRKPGVCSDHNYPGSRCAIGSMELNKIGAINERQGD